MSDVDDLGAKIEADMFANYGGEQNVSTDTSSAIRGRIYANAMAYARVQLSTVAAGQQYIPSKATDLLPKLEWEYKLLPKDGDDIASRQSDVAVAAILSGGAKRSNVEAILTQLLGADFIAYIVPNRSASTGAPFDPATRGNWVSPGTPAFIGRLSQNVLSGTTTFAYEKVGGRDHQLDIGETILVDPGYTRPERVTVIDATESLITTNFARPHAAGTLFTSGRCPCAPTSQRTNLIVLTSTAARNGETRKKVHLVLSKLLRATSRWAIVEENSGQAGPFALGDSLLGVTAIGGLTVSESGPSNPTTISISAAAASAPTVAVTARTPSRSSLSVAPSITVTATSHGVLGTHASSSPTITVAATGTKKATATGAISPTITVVASSQLRAQGSISPTITVGAAAIVPATASSVPTNTVAASAPVRAAGSSAPTVNVAATGAHTP